MREKRILAQRCERQKSMPTRSSAFRGNPRSHISISQYKAQDGLAYYESTRDTASHFFIDYLPKGTYVFEYPTRIQLRGEYQTGSAAIQCMYAPEFNSHSESIKVAVR